MVFVLCFRCLEYSGILRMFSKDLSNDRIDGYGGSGGIGIKIISRSFFFFVFIEDFYLGLYILVVCEVIVCVNKNF